jgi:hypothetical protein
LRFADVTEQAGLGSQGQGMGAATADYDNDGDVDLFVTGFGANILYRNNGNGTFTDVTARAGVADSGWGTSAAFVDYDRDGRLDLFVGKYLNYTTAANKACVAPTGEPDYCNPAVYQGLPSRLFRNNPDGRLLASFVSTMTAMAGSTSMWRMTASRTTFGTTSAVCSRKRLWKPALPTARMESHRQVWAWTPPISMATVSMTSS